MYGYSFREGGDVERTVCVRLILVGLETDFLFSLMYSLSLNSEPV